MALPVPAVRPAQRVVAHRLGHGFPAHEHLEGRLELGDVLALPLYALVVLLELRREPKLHHGLLLVECGHGLLDGAVGAGEVPARRRVIHGGERLGTEPVGVRRIEREAASAVERRNEHADGVTRRGTDLVADGGEAVLLVLAELG